MTLQVYIGSATEVAARFAGSPNVTQTTVASVTSSQVFVLASATSFSAGQSIVVGKEKAVIDTLVGTTATLQNALSAVPLVGAAVRHYDADYTKYRFVREGFTFIDDQKTGGNTGDSFGQDLVLVDHDNLMPNLGEQSRITVFDSINPSVILFGGVIVSTERVIIGKQATGDIAHGWLVEAKGYQWEADAVGIEEEPQTNVNAGEFLTYLMGKYTTLSEGSIDIVNSPTIDYVRLGNYRRFSDVGRELAALWPGAEFFIGNGQSGGLVYFRQKPTTYAPMTLTDAYRERMGPEKTRIRVDHDKVYNIVRLPFYREQNREPDLHVQSTTADSAFLKTSVTLSGQPSTIEESDLLFDDFSDGVLDSDFTEDDLTNASPPDGFNSADGYLVEGEVNSVGGLHMLDTTAVSPTLGDIGRVTDPGEVSPFTGAERQLIAAKEIVVNALGEGVILGVIDQTTVQTTTKSGSTTTRVYVNSIASFSVSDRITVGAEKAYISAIGADYFDLASALSGAPVADVTVSKHRLAKSRIKFGVYFKSTGDLKYIKNGAEAAFGTPRTYSAPNTYSLRLWMQPFETTVSGGISSTGVTLADASNFTTGDVVEIYTAGSRSNPERRTITKSGSNITYSATNSLPKTGYRVRTLPKMVLQIKGGEYGDINGRDWTTIYTDVNTWQDSAITDKADHGVLLCMPKSLVGTITLFQMKNPPGITANIGTRYLHIGTQEVDTAEPDTDCLIRKVGSHFQLDFFPDTKAVWASGTTLEMRYNERWRVELEAKDTDSMRTLAKMRGFNVTTSTPESELVRKGGRALDTIQILPNPFTNTDGLNQSQAILDAVKDPAVTVTIETDTYRDSVVGAGQILRSGMTGIQDLEIKRVELSEIPGAKKDDGASLFRQVIFAGSFDRLSDVLLRRQIKNGSRLVIDDGISDDTFTKLQKVNFVDSVATLDSFSVQTCESPTNIVFSGSAYTLLKCLLIAPSATGTQSLDFSDPDNSQYIPFL